MDVIDVAVERGMHVSGIDYLNRQAWENFELEAAGKKVILFGAGACAGCYFDRYGDSIMLAGVVDNDRKKQGFYADDFISEAFSVKGAKVKIHDISLLDHYSADEIVVLIASTRDYEKIVGDLERKGINNCFVLLIMEANKRRADGKRDGEAPYDLSKSKFAEECCEKECIQKRKVFFKAYADYADHGKYITEALLNIRQDLDIVWSVSDLRTEVPSGVRKIYEKNWKKLIFEMETAEMWILDLAAPEYVIKRDGQLYLQTKHWASITLKKFYLDADTFKNMPEKLEHWKRDGQIIDHIITGSDFDTESCRRGFGFHGKVLQFGSPRSDALFHERENREKIFQHFQLNMGKKAVIYAPTYRFDREKGKSFHESGNISLDFEMVKRSLENRFGGEWYIFMRLHPSVAGAFRNVESPDYVIDVSLYADSQELVSAADVMISDFSSIVFEPAFVKKPVFLFATDLQDYQANEYELLIPYENLPFPVAESNMELRRCIMEFDEELYQNRVQAFMDEYCVHEDGHASERTAEFISNWISVK